MSRAAGQVWPRSPLVGVIVYETSDGPQSPLIFGTRTNSALHSPRSWPTGRSPTSRTAAMLSSATEHYLDDAREALQQENSERAMAIALMALVYELSAVNERLFNLDANLRNSSMGDG